MSTTSTTAIATHHTGSTMTNTDARPALAGARPTRQRLAVVEALQTFTDFRSAQEIHDLLDRQGQSVGLATVYRTLQRLVEADEVDMLRTEDGEAIYRRCSDSHHHHLVCRACGATIEVEGPTVERWTRTMAAEHGYSDVSHTLEIVGTCPRCRTVE
ncbi:Zn/Fe uptake regulator, Fur family [metagenome]|uniref:Zn/Fe uptake regulator, Fur family n=1 Tax=metagenome TaxID=256318 RepID=A0A2P2BWZ2_9ZZZZ